MSVDEREGARALRGFLNIDKPAGITSFDVVRAIRRAARIKRVGHAGTLDPLATGVLPVAVGEATRLIDELVGARKRYRGTVRLGVATETYDAEGAATEVRDASNVTDEAIEAGLATFLGEIAQAPPAYSAVKRAGQPAYKAARRGEPLELEPRRVVTYTIEVLEVDRSEAAHPQVTVEVECGKGFYVRSLAHDLGALLGVGAHLSALARTAVGPFRLEDATPLEAAVRLLEAGESERLVHAPDAVLTDWPALILDRRAVGDARNGRDVQSMPRAGYRGPRAERVRGYGPSGDLVALLKPGGVAGVWHPYRVLPAPAEAPAGTTGTDRALDRSNAHTH